MFGKLISSAIKVVTLPVDAANSAMDIACGGDGSKRSRTNDICNPLADLENLRDKVADAAKDIDED
jgi:hypothetical protein